MRKLSIAEAMNLLKEDGEVFALIRIDKSTKVGDLLSYRTLCTMVEEESAKKVIEQRAKKPVTVDHGKILALHKANWKNKQIADEMGISVPTVTKHIKYEEAKNDRSPKQEI